MEIDSDDNGLSPTRPISLNLQTTRPLSMTADHLSTSTTQTVLNSNLKRYSSEPISINAVGRTLSLPTVNSRDFLLNSPRCTSPVSSNEHFRSRSNSGYSTPGNQPIIGARRVRALRDESNVKHCRDSETSNERLMNISSVVSNSLDDFCIDEQQQTERKRAKSLTEPISIFTSYFMPASCSPSPTRVDSQKQCYSPSAQQIVRHNIAFSPSPSPTPSPTRRGLLRSLSPIAVRPILGTKRKCADSDPYPVVIKRMNSGTNRSTPGCRSPLVPDKDVKFMQSPIEPRPVGTLKHSLSVCSLDSESSNSESVNSDFATNSNPSFMVSGRPFTPGSTSSFGPILFGSSPRAPPEAMVFGASPRPPENSTDFSLMDSSNSVVDNQET